MEDDKQAFEKTEFLVGRDRVPIRAHSDILAASSPVFKAMLFGSMADQSGPVKLKEDCPRAFGALILYVLSKRLVVEDSGEALRLAKMAHKYMMPELMEQCMKYIALDNDHYFALEYYELLKLTSNDEKLISETLTYCQLIAEELLGSNRHLYVSVGTLIDLFKGDKLNITSEETLVEALASYEEANDDSPLKDGLRMALSHIRLVTLEPLQIINCSIIKKLLRPEDMKKILGKIVSPSDAEEMSKNVLRCRGRYWDSYKSIREMTKESPTTVLRKHTLCTADLSSCINYKHLPGFIFGVAGTENIPLLDIIITLKDSDGDQLAEERFRLRDLTNKGKICMFKNGNQFPFLSEKYRLNVLIMNRVSLAGHFCGHTPDMLIRCDEQDPINFILKGFLFE